MTRVRHYPLPSTGLKLYSKLLLRCGIVAYLQPCCAATVYVSYRLSDGYRLLFPSSQHTPIQPHHRRFRTSLHLCEVTSFASSKIGREVGKERAEQMKPVMLNSITRMPTYMTHTLLEESGGSIGDTVMGGLQGRPARALDSRAAFLYGKPSYLMYFWEIADRHQLLQSSLQRLHESVGASDASTAPSVVNVKSYSF